MGDYSPDWYARIAPGCVASAEAVVPLVLATYPAKRVIDVGCGQGWWAKAFENRGCEVLGIDGDYVEDPVVAFRAVDIGRQLPLLGTWDMAVCLEVAEHLDPGRSASFVAELCRLAPVVLWSAAIPGQGGNGHINLREPAWWAEVFFRHGYQMDEWIRNAVWTDERIEPWYAQNIMVARYMPGAKLVLPETRRHPRISYA